VLGDYVVSDGSTHDWAVSAAAFLLLRSVIEGYNLSELRPLIPHCAHTMWAVEGEPDGLYLGGCDLGITWRIHHEGESTIHKFQDEEVIVLRKEWAASVCHFSDQVRSFLTSAWPKKITDNTDREGFELFMTLWDRYRLQASQYAG
jgi:hypothetical protein